MCIPNGLKIGMCIDLLKKHSIDDIKLPVGRLTLRKIFGLRVPDLSSRFFNFQWRSCTNLFEVGSNSHLVENSSIPIYNQKLVNKGAIAELYRIEVLEEFVDQQLQAVAGDARGEGFEEVVYVLALKTFPDKEKRFYADEQAAHELLQGQNGIVKYYGNYSTFQPSSDLGTLVDAIKQATSHDMLFEYGELDLEEYFIHRAPPKSPGEINKFWSSLFKVADALAALHNLKTPGLGNNDSVEYHGWHANITPSNILFIQDNFKLGDLGFARFVTKADHNPKEVMTGGTVTYGKSIVNHGVAVSQNIDVWSLGCVLSIAVTWMVFGHSAVIEYQNRCQRSIRHLIEKTLFDENLRNSTLELWPGDYFHNGNAVLDEITEWHNILRGNCHESDEITISLLRLIDQKLLVEDTSRITAVELSSELADMLDSTVKGPVVSPTTEEPETKVENILLDSAIPKSTTPQHTKSSFRTEPPEHTSDGVGPYSWQYYPSYLVTFKLFNQFLVQVFGQMDFGIHLNNDKFGFRVPRPLTEVNQY
ncbi:hypothetical protein HYALB_00008660 [Hymenoscyphus albidus]|uniref:Protein kinase domain-containing protein n=1 Tax=Hymenoscyphus albidus TaxID=595503 RepID=A0A9N9LDB9_9HELO|nr:hypothetical protein HYALB_00008660 [Hymenoscyphus albidus]